MLKFHGLKALDAVVASLMADRNSMPPLFRIESLDWQDNAGGSRTGHAVIFHKAARVSVTWAETAKDGHLRVGQIVSPRWPTKPTVRDEERLVMRLVPYLNACAECNLFELAPPDWGADSDVLRTARRLVGNLPRSYRHLFNAVFWDGERFRNFCTVPSSLNGHHNRPGGNLTHSVELAEALFRNARPGTDPELLVLLALLHDAGKAAEYRLNEFGRWVLSDRGRLVGHRATGLEWIAEAVARHRVPLTERQRLAIDHCLSAAAHAPDWLGIRRPAMAEAFMLSHFDRLSGTHDLIDRCRVPEGFGRYHEHLRGAPYTLQPLLD